MIWNTDYPECVGGYAIVVEDLSSATRLTTRTQNGSSYDLTGLIPCTNYLISLETYTWRGKVSHRSTVRERTTLANIEVEFQYYVIDHSSIRFEWTKLPEVERCDGDYFVKVIPQDETYSIFVEEHVPYTENAVVVGGLKACRKYNVTLNANFFDIVATIEEVSSPFSSPSNIHGLLVDVQQLVLEWDIPVENGNCVAYYVVSVGEVGDFSTQSNHLSLAELDRCRAYNVSVYQVDVQQTEYASLTTVLELNFDVLNWNLVASMDVRIENQSMVISWPTPIHRGLCEITYELQWNSILIATTKDTHPETTYLIPEFEYCRNHSLAIKTQFRSSTRTFLRDVLYGGDCKLLAGHLRTTNTHDFFPF